MSPIQEDEEVVRTKMQSSPKPYVQPAGAKAKKAGQGFEKFLKKFEAAHAAAYHE